MQRFGAADLVVESKPDLSPVSDADRAVEQAIRDRLAAERPDDAISGEEFGSGGSGPRRWGIDPVGGAENFVRDVPGWGALVGLLGGGDAGVGGGSAPALARRWWAARGTGAWGTFAGGEPRPLAVSGVAVLEDASLSYASLGGWADRGLRDAFVGLTERVW